MLGDIRKEAKEMKGIIFVLIAVLNFLFRCGLLKNVIEEKSTAVYLLALLPMVFWISLFLAHYEVLEDLFFPITLLLPLLIVIISAVCIILPFFKTECWGKYYGISLITAIGELIFFIIPSLFASIGIGGFMAGSSVDFTVCFLFEGFKLFEI